MHKHFKKTTLPIIRRNGYRAFVEIGVARGETSIRVLRYCKAVGGRLIGIDPKPSFEPPEKLRKYWTLHRDLSLNVLGSLSGFDCVFIDGDHNWYTVYNELRLIDERIEPSGTIFLHDVAPPWARRDMYHEIETIPPEYRHPCTREGEGAWVANEEGGERNGVLAAVIDFLRESPRWLVTILPEHHGLGVLQRFGGRNLNHAQIRSTPSLS